MLEHEPEGGGRSESVPTGDAADSTTPARRARVSRRKAAPPPAEAGPSTEPGATPEPGAAIEAGSATDASASAAAEPAPRTARRRRKTAADAEVSAAPDPVASGAGKIAESAGGAVPGEASGDTSAAATSESVAPVKATRSRRKKAAPAPDETSEQVVPTPAAASGDPAEEPAVAPEAETGKVTRSRGRAPVPPVVLFMPPEVDAVRAEPAAAEPAPAARRGSRRAKAAVEDVPPAAEVTADGEPDSGRRRRRARRDAEPETPLAPADEPAESPDDVAGATDDDDDEYEDTPAGRRRRRRGRRGRGRGKGPTDEYDDGDADEPAAAESGAEEEPEDDPEDAEAVTRRRRRRRRKGSGDVESGAEDGVPTVVKIREPRRAVDEVQGVSGSTRLEAKRQRRRDGREQRRTRPPILSESEFLARREAVDRVMVVRQKSDRMQIAVLEDGVLVEHYVARSTSGTMVGNVYLGRVQNVLPSMEAAFVDVGRGRNAVLYAGEVNWDATGLEGRARSIEQALRSGDSVLVQVTKDPMGHKGARLSSHIALSGRHLVYVPHGNASGISRKLPDTERKRLRDVLKKLVPDGAGVIVRTAAEGASEDELARDVKRLQAQWEDISAKASEVNAPALLSEEPDLVIRVVRDLFNEDFRELVVQGDEAYGEIEAYLNHVSPDLVERLRRHTGVADVFAEKRIDEQILKALDRKVFLPSGGHLVIDRTEAMTVVDVNTGKYTGAGGNLEETVTRNNLEAAEEIVRQLRLRDLGGIVVIDFIDMVLESNRELVLRRLTECLGRDRTKHQVTEITSLGLVQMTRKRIGAGLLEAFSETCEHCKGRGLLIHSEPVPEKGKAGNAADKVKAVASAAVRDSGQPARRRGRRDAEAAAPVQVPDSAEDAGVSDSIDLVENARAASNGTGASGVIVNTGGAGASSGDEEYDISGYDLSRYSADDDDEDDAVPLRLTGADEDDAVPLRLTGADDPDAADDDEEDGDEPVPAGAGGRRRARRGGARRRTRP